MSDFPTRVAFPSSVITLMSPEALGDSLGLLGTNTASSAFFSANAALFIPFRIGTPTTITKITWQNGSAVSGNVDVGIYDSAGNRIVSLGSTAQSGTTAKQTGDITDTTLNPGLYYMAIAADNGTATFRTMTSGGDLYIAGVQSMAAAFPLPSAATFATPTNTDCPFLTLNLNTVV